MSTLITQPIGAMLQVGGAGSGAGGSGSPQDKLAGGVDRLRQAASGSDSSPGADDGKQGDFDSIRWRKCVLGSCMHLQICPAYMDIRLAWQHVEAYVHIAALYWGGGLALG